jgi:hypothetical protein
MHSFDSGTGVGAKKNNWNLLERVFIKYSIPITKELLNQVSLSQPKSTTIVLTIIFGHLNKKGYVLFDAKNNYQEAHQIAQWL